MRPVPVHARRAGLPIVTAFFALALAVLATGAARAQANDEIDALDKQIVLLREDGKHAEALELAKRSLALAEQTLQPNHPAIATALDHLATAQRSLNRFGEAEPLFKRALAIREAALGPTHTDVAATLDGLGQLYGAQARFMEAEPLFKRALAIREATLGYQHVNVAATLSGLAQMYRVQARFGEAEPLFVRALALREAALGPMHRHVASTLGDLALLYRARGRFDQAEPLYLRAIAIGESLGPEHRTLATPLNNLASMYRAQARFGEAETLYRRALAINEKTLGPEHPGVAGSYNVLATLYRAQGRYGEAEPLFQRALGIFEQVYGPDHPDVATSLNDLASVHEQQGRFADAGQLFQRALAIREKALGPEHPDVATSLNNLAILHRARGRHGDAEPLYQRALAIWEKALGPDHLTVATGLVNLADTYRNQRRYAEAEPLLHRALAISQAALGPEHPAVATTIGNLANLYRAQDRFGEAQPLLERALAISEKALGPDHPDVSMLLHNLAVLHFAQQDWTRAAGHWRRGTSLNIRRAQRGTSDVGGTLTGRGRSDVERARGQFIGLVRAIHRLSAGSRAGGPDQAGAMFEIAQWAHASEAAASLTQMAARGARGDPGLSRLARERQDLVAEWQRRDRVRTLAVSQAPDQRDRATEAVNATRLTAIDAAVGTIDIRLVAEFPDYAALASPAPLTIAQVQSDLQPDEALVLFLDMAKFEPAPEETFVWVVTRTDVRWVRSELGSARLAAEVAALRCGLDPSSWWGEGAAKCAGLLNIAPDKVLAGQGPLPFDLGRAHALYKGLFGQIEDLIAGKHLLVVPSGPLTQLPFQVLVTAPSPVANSPDANYKAAAWMARGHALTVLPAVSSLRALRRTAKPSAATRPLIGFGNPLLDGDQSHPEFGAYYKERARLAREHKGCGQLAATQRPAAASGVRRSPAPLPMRTGLVDDQQIRRQAALPETADELCAVARDLLADASDILLGARATEREIKALSASGALARYRILHFATHGALAGQLSGTSEPGLILTPPATATLEDDGYLSASEIAELKLDADWVILSACNTAAAGAGGTEALAGLARAFFYAQARALLVSHWEVYSDATVKLITSAVGAMSRDPAVGRAEALRRAMLAIIDTGKPHEAQPAYWAPFVVVGEGAAGRAR